MAPALIFSVACFYLKNDTQIKLAAFISSIYGLAMISIIIGAISRILNSSLVSPSSLIIMVLVFVFLIAGLLHPSEIKCLLPGFLYFITLPSAFVLLNIYAIINLNNISWGTREVMQPKLIEKNSIDKKYNYLFNYFNKLFNKSSQASQLDEENNGNLKCLMDSLERFSKLLSRNSIIFKFFIHFLKY
jgi:hypothetical protein